MLVNQNAFKELSLRATEFENGRSTHWQHEQKNFEFDDELVAKEIILNLRQI